MKINILFSPASVIKNRPIILKKSLMYAVVIGVFTLGNAYGQAVKDGSYTGLEDMHYLSYEKHNVFKWFHLTYLTI